MEIMSSIFFACAALGFVHSAPSNDNGYSELLNKNRVGNKTLDVQMPGVTPKTEDFYVCTSVPVPAGENYIVQFEPLASGDTAHHMLMFGCKEPAEYKKSWECGQTCKGKPNILFAWAKNAPPTNLPDDVGFKIGGNSEVKYIVLQIHYKNPAKEPDSSGVRLHYTPKRQKNIAGIALLLAAQINIPPHTPEVLTDVSCQFSSKTPIYPFGFRTHAHSLSTVITGYHYNGSYHLIGKGNPQWPQAFYPVKDKIRIRNNDILMARCVYDSTNKDTYVRAGPTHNDEMCNFYIMYYTDATGGQPFYECFGNWRQGLFLDSNFPKEESKTPLPPNPALEEEAEHGHKETSGIDPESEDTKLNKGEELPPALGAVANWPDVGGIKLGQVAGVATDSEGNVHIFHRADRNWDYNTFDPVTNQYQQKQRGPITESTILVFNPSGKLIKQWGKNMFYLPHGLSIDDKDNIWVTDVAMHQVFKFNKGEEKPSLTLGKAFEPGNDKQHFCKPTDIAILPTGEFFVSDGYCNHRILKYAADGTVMKSWGDIDGDIAADGYPAPGAFKLPHGLTLAEDRKLLCVADRENGRIQCFDYEGNFKFQIHLSEFGHKVYAMAYTPHNGGVLYAINADQPDQGHNEGFTIKIDSGKLESSWKPKGGFSRPHDVAVSKDGKCVYVAEIGTNKVWKFHPSFDVGIHKSQKKMGEGVNKRPSNIDKPDVTSDEDDDTENVKKSEISKEVESNSDSSGQGENNTTPIIVGVVLIVPVVVVVVATIAMRIRRRMANDRFYTADGGSRGGFNLGNILGRKHKGFQQLNTEELDHLNSDSEDEFSRKT